MAILGDLVVKVKVEGDVQAIAALNRINQQAQQQQRSFASANSSASAFFSQLASGSSVATRGLVNFGDGIKVTNGGLLDLLQTATLLKLNLGNIFKIPSFPDFIKGVKDLRQTVASLNALEYATAATKLMDNPSKINPKTLASLQSTVAKTSKEDREALSDFIKHRATSIDRMQDAIKKGFFSQEDRDAMQAKSEEYRTELNLLDDMSKGPIPKILSLVSKRDTLFANILNNIQELQINFPLLAEGLKYISNSFGQLIVQTGKFYSGVFSVAIPAIVAIGTAASEAADKVERMKMKMAASLIGQGALLPGQSPMGESENLLKAYKQLSIPSAYTAQQIGEAGQRLEAFGLNSVKVLNTALKLAEVFGGMPDDLEMVVRMFGRMASGDLPDIEVLSRFGLSKANLNTTAKAMNLPALVDKNTGKLAGTAAQGLEVLLEIIKNRYEELYNLQKGTFGPEKASAQEKFTTLLETIGKPINDGLVPILKQLQQFIESFMGQAGGAEAIGNAFASIAKVFQEPAVSKFIEQFAYDFLAFLIEAGNEFQKFIRFLAGFYGILRNMLPMIMTVMNPANGLGMIGSLMSGQSGDSSKGWLVNTPGAFMGNLYNRSAKLRGLKGLPEPGVNMDKYLNGPTVKKAMDDQLSTLQDIKDNTARSADALELRKANLGGRGGPLAQLGMGINVNQAGTTAGINRAAIPPSFALLNPVNSLQKSIQMEVFRTTNQQYVRRY